MALSGGKELSARDHDSDLSAILSTEERVDLTLLIANITEVMRRHVAETFDASIASAKKPRHALHITDKNPNIDDTKPHKETDEEEKARKLRQRREKELSAPKMLELKNTSLEFFEKWRESVISRVGVAVNNPKEVVEEQKEKATIAATPDSAAPAEPKVIREYAVKPL
jgi:pyruvate/2-oxoacid:ferredoxin oxidoreductase alpha subunit